MKIKTFYFLILSINIFCTTALANSSEVMQVYMEKNEDNNTLTIYESFEYKEYPQNLKVFGPNGKMMILPFDSNEEKKISGTIKVNSNTIKYTIEVAVASSRGMCSSSSYSIISLLINNQYNLNSIWLDRDCFNQYSIEKMMIDFNKMEVVFIVLNRGLQIYDSHYSQRRAILDKKFVKIVKLDILAKKESLMSLNDIFLKNVKFTLEELIEGKDYY